MNPPSTGVTETWHPPGHGAEKPSGVGRVGRLLGRGPREWAAIARVVATHIRVRRLLRREGFPEAARRLGLAAAMPADARRVAPKLSNRVSRLMWVCDRTLWLRPLGSTCLSRALTTRHVLAQSGLDVDVVIGVTRRDGFEAHAWLEIAGHPLNGFAGPEAYAPIARFEAQNGRHR